MKYLEEIIKFFSENGSLSVEFPNYEFRKSQLDMAVSVYKSLCNKDHIFIEAPTGIGKSFAYLVASILYAIENNKKAIISTHTINLQEQLIYKDLPTLKRILPVEFTYALLKGKSNYLCPKRLQKSSEKAYSLFESDELKTLDRIISWAAKTEDGTLTDLNFKVSPTIWSNICAEVGICSNKTCGNPEETNCFYQKAKYNASKANIVILNHYLFFTLFQSVKDINKNGYLYSNDFVIFDEAQTLESTAAELIIPKVSRELIKFNLLKLYNSKSKKGFLLNFPLLEAIPIIENIKEINELFFRDIKKIFFESDKKYFDKKTSRVYEKNMFDNLLQDSVEELLKKLRSFRSFCKDDIQENELNDYILKFGSFLVLINNFINQTSGEKDFVYWVELSSLKPDSNVYLCTSPIDLSEFFRKYIFKEDETCVLTSATLSINNNFSYYKNRLGGEVSSELKLPTQFDFANQVKLYIPKNIIMPQKENSLIYETQLTNWIKYFINRTDGKALVLFTNSKLMKKIGGIVKEEFINLGIELLIQGEGISRNKLLNSFKENINSVLFGLESFWLGVDVPGEALTNLIITRLPFLVPDHPLVQAKLEFIDINGGNSFMDYSLPEAIFKFRQGVGRLIRSRNDEGIIAILDTRVLNKTYGRHFLSSIEECPKIIIENDGTEFPI